MRGACGSLLNRLESRGSRQLHFYLQYNGGAVKIEVDIPISEEALDENAKNRLRHDTLEAAVLRLFDERRIPSAEAAEDLGLTRIQFMELTRRRGVAHYDYTAENLTDDLADLDQIEKQLPPSDSAR
jgi:predicted HTH domain antitoxin